MGRVCRLGRPSGHLLWFVKHPHSASRPRGAGEGGEGAIPALRGHLGPPRKPTEACVIILGMKVGRRGVMG